MTGFFPSPMAKMLVVLVANKFPSASLMWAISKLPGCFSTLYRIPTLPMLLPPVTLTEAPFSNLINPSTSKVSRLSYKVLLNIN